MITSEEWRIGSVAAEVGDARAARAEMDRRIEELKPLIGIERYLTLDQAVGNLEVAIRHEYLARLVRVGIDALDAGEPTSLVLHPTARATAPHGTHDVDTCECCRARWQYRGRRVLGAVAAALALGVTLCAAAPRFLGVASDVAAGLVR